MNNLLAILALRGFVPSDWVYPI